MDSKSDDPLGIVRTFVIRRALTGLPLGKNILAHSGLLVLLRCGSFYILERLDGRSRMRCEEITFQVVHTHQYHQVITLDELRWTKQRYGQAVSPPRTVHEAQSFFIEYVQQYPYDSRFKNCHIAQEDVRRWLGLTVPEPSAMANAGIWLVSWIPQGAVDSSGGNVDEQDKLQ
ncbi:hypothetical protein BJX66DRAFT_345859 [Aspergillus keveii]|uniref:Uncharacterized protein n=1 Tax=Aspergillus keveii TaxID=714993 RepID=A0ABR4FGN6_9EURO